MKSVVYYFSNVIQLLYSDKSQTDIPKYLPEILPVAKAVDVVENQCITLYYFQSSNSCCLPQMWLFSV